MSDRLAIDLLRGSDVARREGNEAAAIYLLLLAVLASVNLDVAVRDAISEIIGDKANG